LFTIFFLALPPPLISSPLSLHDALPILSKLTIASETVHVAHVLSAGAVSRPHPCDFGLEPSSVLAITAAEETTDIAEVAEGPSVDRKSTRLNSSHLVISYAAFCLKKKTT